MSTFLQNIKLIASIILILAPLRWPYGYYMFLRWTVSSISLITTLEYIGKRNYGAILFLGLTILYNPIFKITMSKSSWTPINIISAIIFFIAYLYEVNKKNEAH